jgi:hypothetical protein
VSQLGERVVVVVVVVALCVVFLIFECWCDQRAIATINNDTNINVVNVIIADHIAAVYRSETRVVCTRSYLYVFYF